MQTRLHVCMVHFSQCNSLEEAHVFQSTLPGNFHDGMA